MSANSRYHIYVMPPHKISDSEYAQAYSLTLPDGDMRNILTRKAWVKPEYYTYYLCKEGVKLLGWAILTKRPDKRDRSDRYEIDIFVDPEYRKKSVGADLVAVIKQDVDYATLNAYPYDLTGVQFFNRLGIQTHIGWDGGDLREYEISLYEFKMEVMKPFIPILTGLLNWLAKLLENVQKHTPRTLGK